MTSCGNNLNNTNILIFGETGSFGIRPGEDLLEALITEEEKVDH